MARLGTLHCGKPGTVRGRAQQRINEGLGVADPRARIRRINVRPVQHGQRVVTLSVDVTILVFLAS